jgi:hypothetical protein
MAQIGKQLSAIEEYILAGGECGAREKKRTELVEKYIELANCRVKIMELYTLIMRNSFPWVEPMVSREIAELKRKIEKMQQTASSLQGKLKQKA